MFEKEINSDTVATNLKIHLLRTLCTYFANNVLSYVSRTQNVDALTTKVIHSNE